MKLRVQFPIGDDTSSIQATKTFFIKEGFKTVDETNNTVSFSKGSTLLNMVTFNPLSWKSRIEISVKGNEVLAEFNIDTTFQAVTPKEEKLWDSFIENYRLSLVNHVDVSQAVSEELNATKKDNLRYVMWACIGAVVGGLPFGVLAHFSGIDMLAPMGAAGGAILFVMMKINRDSRSA